MSQGLKLTPIRKQRVETYSILNPNDLEFLRDFYSKVKKLLFMLPLLKLYSKNPYPSKEELSKICQKLNRSEHKIRNWFKYQRKKNVLLGRAKFEVSFFIVKEINFFSKKKNSFSKENIRFLMSEFTKNKNPTSEEYLKLYFQ